MTVERVCYVIGVCVQGLVIGSLLMVALVELASSEVGAQIFRYQGF